MTGEEISIVDEKNEESENAEVQIPKVNNKLQDIFDSANEKENCLLLLPQTEETNTPLETEEPEQMETPLINLFDVDPTEEVESSEEEAKETVEIVKVKTPFDPKKPFLNDFLIALDTQVTENRNREVIELSFAVVSVREKLIVHNERFFCKPEKTKLELIPSRSRSQKAWFEDLENAGSLQDAVNNLVAFIEKHFISKQKSFCFVSLGEIDFRLNLAADAKSKKISLAPYFSVFFDIVQETNKWLSMNQLTGSRVIGKDTLPGICSDLNIFTNRGHHASLDCTLTIADICIKLLARVEDFVSTRYDELAEYAEVPFNIPIDITAEAEHFNSSHSKCIMLQGLSLKSTKSDVEKFLNNVNIEKIFMVNFSEGNPNGSAFVIFKEHEDAKNSLSSNGRMFDKCIIQVIPSDENKMKDMKHLLGSFPAGNQSNFKRDYDDDNYSRQSSSKRSRGGDSRHSSPRNNSPPPKKHQEPKVGDWICPNISCEFPNFPTRIECMRCQTPKPYSAIINEGPKRSVNNRVLQKRDTDRPGDWNCPNDICKYHNYSTRTNCYRCQTKKPERVEPPPNPIPPPAPIAYVANPQPFPIFNYGARQEYSTYYTQYSQPAYTSTYPPYSAAPNPPPPIPISNGPYSNPPRGMPPQNGLGIQPYPPMQHNHGPPQHRRVPLTANQSSYSQNVPTYIRPPIQYPRNN
ncbi:hypothetical protein HK099_007699 [Clydaea vesicula]|uniref:Uncharacterized protein n=1 Tax=Clydaea vesicula TaxID=447962 RepID=A0AAD5XYB6_9FUNG|nr:hypothetical protein HK099_007699 [Clydaea vesicula]KAJ3397415.1 hypothetical protein HDU92_007804 [Lobulomyces angularis]